MVYGQVLSLKDVLQFRMYANISALYIINSVLWFIMIMVHC